MKKLMSLIIYILISLELVGCWNYREIDQVDIVLGFGIDSKVCENKSSDKMDTSEFSITYELVSIKSKEGEIESRTLNNTGDTVFRTVRKIIEKNGKTIYWAHTKLLIIGEEFAKSGITEILDYTMRDAEFRPDVNVLITNDSKAEKMFSSEPSEVISLKLNDALKNQKKIGTFESTTVWNITDKLSKKGFEPSIPMVKVEESEDGKLVHTIGGMAVFKGPKMVGKLSEDETLYYLFIDDEIENQPLSIEYLFDEKVGRISLEIFKNTTKVRPIIKDNNISMSVDIKCNVAINELSHELEIINEEKRKELEQYIEKEIEKGINDLLKRIQKELKSDIFGFGDLIKRNNNKVWKEIEDNWDEIFSTIPVLTNIKVQIKKSALSSEPIQIDKY